MQGFIQIKNNKCSHCGNIYGTTSADLYYCVKCGQALRVNLCDACKKQVEYYCPKCNASKQHIAEDDYGCFWENRKGHGDLMDVEIDSHSCCTNNCNNLESIETLLTDFQNWHGLTRDYKSAIRNCQKHIGEILNGNWEVVTKTKVGAKSAEEYWENIRNRSEHKVSKRSSDLYKFYSKTFSNDKFNIIEHIYELLKTGDKLYALSLVDLYIELAIKTKIVSKATNNEKASLNDQISGIRKFRDYIDNNFLLNITKTNTHCDKVRNSIVKPLVHKIDGAVALAKEIGEENFIRMALRQSYFFSVEIVDQRNCSIEAKINKSEYLPARKTTKEEMNFENYHQIVTEVKGKTEYGIFTSEQGDGYNIVRDKDGNANVRRLIKEMTGYTACEGSDSIFQNYTISHIWGRAYDPRYFTSFWNIVLVPDWANGLLDKEGEEGSLESKMKATYMTICHKLYSLKGNSRKGYWKKMKMRIPEIINYKDSITEKSIEDLTINVIETKTNCNGQSVCAPIRITKYPFEK